MTLIGNAQAIIGAPLTPVSYAGVARRTTRRAIAVTSSASSASAAASTSTAAASTSSSAAVQSHGKVPIGTVVLTLPQGCTSVTVNGKNYNVCDGSYYQAAMQGNNLVYIVVQNPIQ
jgi:hypothetical protein